MAHLEEIPRGRDTGQTRFRVVPGPHVEGIDYERLVEILTVPPERIQIFPGFPEPQRRGPGRTLFEQGARGVIFPPPTDRTVRDRQTQTVQREQSAGAAIGSLAQCLGQGGTIFNARASVAAGGVNVQASFRLPYPFVITHVQWSADGAVLFASDVRVKVADDNDTSGGLDTSGLNIIGQYGTSVGFRASPTQLEIFPYHIVRAAGKFLKIAQANNSAAAQIIDTAVSILFLA